MGTRHGRRTLGALALLVALPVVLSALGHPVLVRPTSQSMEPTFGPDDLVLVHPFARRFESGDVVVFAADSRAGAWSVHRIVGGDAHGYTTRGDANDADDQSRGEPYVTSDRILARAVEGGDGGPVVLRGLGTPLVEARAAVLQAEAAVGGAAALRAILLAVAFLVLGVGALARAREPPAAPRGLAAELRRAARRAFPRGLRGAHLGALLLASLLLGTALAASAARDEVATSMVVMDAPPLGSERAAAPGDAVPRALATSSLGFLPSFVVVEPASAGVRVPDAVHRVGARETVVVAYEEVAGATRGLQRDSVVVWRYPALLPEEAVLAMHARAPGSPFLAVALALALPGLVAWRILDASRTPLPRLLGTEGGA